MRSINGYMTSIHHQLRLMRNLFTLQPTSTLRLNLKLKDCKMDDCRDLILMGYLLSFIVMEQRFVVIIVAGKLIKIRGHGCETPTNISIDINDLDAIFIRLWLDEYFAEIMRVDDRPIKMLSRIVGKWKGYDVYNPDGVDDPKMVLLHREGMSPYIPVTRKQYLDRYFECLQRFFDKDIKSYEQREGLALLMKKEEWDEQMKKQQKLKDQVIEYYQDELEATTEGVSF